jgi:hypothetical protein
MASVNRTRLNKRVSHWQRPAAYDPDNIRQFSKKLLEAPFAFG